jgi:hypothetical protein
VVSALYIEDRGNSVEYPQYHFGHGYPLYMRWLNGQSVAIKPRACSDTIKSVPHVLSITIRF